VVEKMGGLKVLRQAVLSSAQDQFRISCTKSRIRHFDPEQNRAGFLCQPESCCYMAISVLNSPKDFYSIESKPDKHYFQKLKTLASAAKSIKCGAPSKIMFAKNFDSST